MSVKWGRHLLLFWILFFWKNQKLCILLANRLSITQVYSQTDQMKFWAFFHNIPKMFCLLLSFFFRILSIWLILFCFLVPGPNGSRWILIIHGCHDSWILDISTDPLFGSESMILSRILNKFHNIALNLRIWTSFETILMQE